MADNYLRRPGRRLVASSIVRIDVLEIDLEGLAAICRVRRAGKQQTQRPVLRCDIVRLRFFDTPTLS